MKENSQKKRFRLVHKNALVCGVCAGFSEYFDVDVWIVRAIFIVATIFSRGSLLIVYFFLFFFVPYSDETLTGASVASDNVVDKIQEKYQSAKSSAKNTSWFGTVRDDIASLKNKNGVILLITLLLILALLWRIF